MRPAARRAARFLLASVLIAAFLATGCQRQAPTSASPFGLKAMSPDQTATARRPETVAPVSRSPLTGRPVAGQPVAGQPLIGDQAAGLASEQQGGVPESLSRLRGLVNDLPAMIRELDGASYQIQVVPSSSQAKADRIAREWASDAQQLYVIWAYWKLPVLSITRHAYYSPSKGKALKVEFTVSTLFSKSYEEAADGFDQATMILNEARDRHAYGVKDAHAVAKRMGYMPSQYGAAVLLDIKTYGPLWVFADMPSQTEGQPVMLVNAESGMVTQGGEAMLIAELLFERAGY